MGIGKRTMTIAIAFGDLVKSYGKFNAVDHLSAARAAREQQPSLD
ncbi:MAG: hypothetical protein ACO3S6_04345 [Aquiluna sp.]